MNIIQKDIEEYTNLGLLLSDQNPTSIELAVFEDDDMLEFKLRRSFTGSLIKQADDIGNFLEQVNHVQSKIIGFKRFDMNWWPKEALREAVLNAVMHTDYSIAGSAQIRISDQKFKVISHGGLPKGINSEELGTGISVPRNRNLSLFFYRIGLVEAFGTGLNRIDALYKNQSDKPSYRATQNAFFVVLPKLSVDSEYNGAGLGSQSNISASGIVGQSHKTDNSSNTYNKLLNDPNESKILFHLQTKGPSSRAQLQNDLNLTISVIRRCLKNLKETGWISTRGNGKNIEYVYSADQKTVE